MRSLACTPDGGECRAGDDTVRVFRLDEARERVRMPRQSGKRYPSTVAVAPDGTFAVVGSGFDVLGFDLAGGETRFRIELGAHYVTSVALSDDGRALMGPSRRPEPTPPTAPPGLAGRPEL